MPGIVNQLVVQTDCKDETRTKNVVETTNQKTRKGKQKAELDNSLEESNISWFGNVIGRKDGDIEVAWADGMVSKVCYFAIFLLDYSRLLKKEIFFIMSFKYYVLFEELIMFYLFPLELSAGFSRSQCSGYHGMNSISSL